MDRLLPDFGLTGLSEAEIDNLNSTRRPDLTPDESVDLSAKDFGHLATLLGA